MVSSKEHYENILGSIEYIQEWTEDMTRKQIESDLKTTDAVLYRLHIIGKSAKSIGSHESKYHLILSSLSIFSNFDFIDLDIVYSFGEKEGKGDLKQWFDDIEKVYMKEFRSNYYPTYLGNKKDIANK